MLYVETIITHSGKIYFIK